MSVTMPEGWTKVRGNKCHRRLLGARCAGFPRCDCLLASRPAWADHLDFVRDPIGRMCLASQPYGLTDEAARELDKWCSERGLRWEIDGRSWHFAGTVLILITAPEEDPFT